MLRYLANWLSFVLLVGPYTDDSSFLLYYTVASNLSTDPAILECRTLVMLHSPRVGVIMIIK